MPKFLFVLSSLLLTFGLQAQNDNRENDARRDLDYYTDDVPRDQGEERFIDNLWFGGGGQLNFFSRNGISVFVVGLSPMVGYKISPNISVGPRLSLNYNSINCSFSDNRHKYFNWEAGMFGRFKVFNQFFLHGEYSIENRRLLFSDCSEPLKQLRSMPYLGVGYTTGFEGSAGSEVLLLFRLRNDGQGIQESPFVIRFGFNYNF